VFLVAAFNSLSPLVTVFWFFGSVADVVGSWSLWGWLGLALPDF